ncbi:MAG: hypothetical protein V4671_08710 [Armatimonadota bacterium]
MTHSIKNWPYADPAWSKWHAPEFKVSKVNSVLHPVGVSEYDECDIYGMQVVRSVDGRTRRSNTTLLGLLIPHELNLLKKAVEKSEWILKLEDDWDGEGSPPYKRGTWERSCKFLLANATEIVASGYGIVLTPQINNGPEGSIDLYWDNAGSTLLINFPEDPKATVTYYGSGTQGANVQGTLDISVSNDWLLMRQTRKLWKRK